MNKKTVLISSGVVVAVVAAIVTPKIIKTIKYNNRVNKVKEPMAQYANDFLDYYYKSNEKTLTSKDKKTEYKLKAKMSELVSANKNNVYYWGKEKRLQFSVDMRGFLYHNGNKATQTMPYTGQICAYGENCFYTYKYGLDPDDNFNPLALSSHFFYQYSYDDYTLMNSKKYRDQNNRMLDTNEIMAEFNTFSGNPKAAYSLIERAKFVTESSIYNEFQNILFDNYFAMPDYCNVQDNPGSGITSVSFNVEDIGYFTFAFNDYNNTTNYIGHFKTAPYALIF